MNDVTILFDDLKKSGDGHEVDTNFGPVSEERVAEAEAQLGIKFPTSFKNYQLQYAGGRVFGLEIAGIQTERSQAYEDANTHLVDDIVATNEEMQNYLQIPDRCIYFASDGGQILFFLDTARTDDDECPVVRFGPGAEDFEMMSANFYEFIDKWCQNARRGQ